MIGIYIMLKSFSNKKFESINKIEKKFLNNFNKIFENQNYTTTKKYKLC